MSSSGIKSRKRSVDSARGSLLKQVTTPLGFYVLALLIIEGTLTIVLQTSRLSQEQMWAGFLLMIAIFGIVVAIVTLFAALAPKKLLFGKEELQNPVTAPSAVVDQLEDILAGASKGADRALIARMLTQLVFANDRAVPFHQVVSHGT